MVETLYIDGGNCQSWFSNSNGYYGGSAEHRVQPCERIFVFLPGGATDISILMVYFKDILRFYSAGASSAKASLFFLVVLVASLWPAQAVESATHTNQPPYISPSAESELSYEVIELTRGETFNIFSMAKKVWTDSGKPVRVFVLPTRHPLHKRFAKQRIGSFPHVLSAIWDRHVYSGSGQRPTEVDTEEKMLEAVSNTEGAVGYMPSPDDKTKILLIRHK